VNRALEISNLKIGYPQKRGEPILVAGPMDISINHGELICLLGPNGVGKTTLLRTMAGIQDPLDGAISILQQSLSDVDKKKLARLLSVVLTEGIGYGNLTSYELISLGRIPYTGWFGNLDGEDKEKISWAIESTNILHLAHKSIHELSDGERQKVMIARALAQDTPVILLDEPTAHLDLPNRIDIIRLLKKLARETGKAIIMSTHELDLALQAADRIWLMTWENIIYSGTPEDLVLNDVFGKTFTRDGIEFEKETGVFKVVEPHSSEIHIHGDTVGVFWTKRALERLGYTVFFGEDSDESIKVQKKDSSWMWEYYSPESKTNIQSIEELVEVFKPNGDHL
jgi:iron complex transport system ATP-binding protein